MYKLKKHNILIIIACIFIICWLFLIDYSDLLSSGNISAYLGIIVMILIIASNILEKEKIENQEKE